MEEDNKREAAKKMLLAEEAKKKRMEEEKAKVEQAKKQLEERRKKAEAERLKKLEEFKKRQEDMQRNQKEQQAANRIRKVLAKVRLATPETLEQLEQELNDAQMAETEVLGSQLDVVVAEAEQALAAGRKRVDTLNEARAKEQAKKDEAERMKKEIEEKGKELITQLEAMLAEAEGSVESAKAASAPLLDKNADWDDDSIASAVAEAESLAKEAVGKLKDCSDFVSENGHKIRHPASLPFGAQKTESHLALEELVKKIAQARKSGDEVFRGVPAAKERAARRASAQAMSKALEATFTKYDKDGDKQLSRAEASAYAKGEFKVTLSDDELDKVFNHYVDDGELGVQLKDLRLLNCVIGWARERVRDVKRREERVEREERIRAATEMVLNKIKGVAKIVGDAEKELAKVEKAFRSLATKAKRIPADEMLRIADEHDALVEPAATAVDEARKAFDGMSEGILTDSEELRGIVSKDPSGKRSHATLGRLEMRLTRIRTILRRFRDSVGKKEAQEKVQKRRDILKVIWHNQRLKSLTDDELFEAFDADKDGEICESDFVQFLTDADPDVVEASVEYVPPKPKEEAPDPGEAANGDDAAAAGGEEAAEEADKPEGEAEKPKATQVPEKEEASVAEPKVEHIELSPDAMSVVFADFLKESEAEAASLNKETFMNLIRIRYVALKNLAVTSELSIESSGTVCRLEFGDVLEHLQGPMREESLGVARIQARSPKDGSVGWVTVVGNKDGKFLQPGGSVFKVLKPTRLTESLEEAGAVEAKDAKDTKGEAAPLAKLLKEGEKLHVLEGPVKDEKSGLLRVRARVRSSGDVGWVTTAVKGVAMARPVLWK